MGNRTFMGLIAVGAITALLALAGCSAGSAEQATDQAADQAATDTASSTSSNTSASNNSTADTSASSSSSSGASTGTSSSSSSNTAPAATDSTNTATGTAAGSVPEPSITEDQAKQTALGQAGVAEADATFTKVHLDYDDGVLDYDIEFVAGGMEYDCEVDATTGAIRSYESEPVNS